jgi:transcriptional regulator with XRE-family HTH domain
MINEVLKLLRIISNYRQNELAEELGISPALLSQVESGERNPTMDLLDRYCEVFSLRKSTLMFFAEETGKVEKSGNVRQFFRRKALRLLQLMEGSGAE